jgi:hypothetical protein
MASPTKKTLHPLLASHLYVSVAFNFENPVLRTDAVLSGANEQTYAGLLNAFREMPGVDGSALAKKLHAHRWSAQPCVRPEPNTEIFSERARPAVDLAARRSTIG